MNKLTRRGFVGASLAGTALPTTVWTRRSNPVPEDFRPVTLRPEIRKVVDACRHLALEELKPTRSQLERGFELHYSSYVADVCGCLYVADPLFIWKGDRLNGELASYRNKLERDGLDPEDVQQRVVNRWRDMKAFESAFDPQWREDYRSLYRLAGIDLAVEDVGHFSEPSFRAGLQHTARAGFVYDKIKADAVRVSGVDDLDAARQDEKVAILLHLHGANWFAMTPDPIQTLDLFFALGVRASQLTYHEQNSLASSDDFDGERDRGLSKLGKRVVRRMNELGIMVNLAHCGHRSGLDAIEASSEPVINAHTGCRAIYDHYKNEDDDYLRTLARKGGVAGMYAGYLSSDPDSGFSFNAWLPHLEHAVKVAGIDHVAIPSDLTFMPDYPPRPMSWSNWPYYTVGLVCRGFSDAEIRKLIGGNFLRLAKQVLDKRPWGPFIARGEGYNWVAR